MYDRKSVAFGLQRCPLSCSDFQRISVVGRAQASQNQTCCDCTQANALFQETEIRFLAFQCFPSSFSGFNPLTSREYLTCCAVTHLRKPSVEKNDLTGCSGSDDVITMPLGAQHRVQNRDNNLVAKAADYSSTVFRRSRWRNCGRT